MIALELALKRDPELARVRDEAGVSVVSRAVYMGRFDLAREISSRRNDLDLFEASCIGDRETVRAHLERDPESIDAVSPDGFRPIGLAAFFGHTSLLEMLIQGGADIHLRSDNAMRVCPLHSAAAHSDPSKATELTRLLLAAGADPNARQKGGFAPLHEAAINGNLALVRVLLEFGAEPGLANDERKTPIDYARETARADVLDALTPSA